MAHLRGIPVSHRSTDQGLERGVCCESCLCYTVMGTVWKVRNPKNKHQPHYYCTICHDSIVSATPEVVDDRA